MTSGMRYVLREIVLAQAASDAGKNIDTYELNGAGNVRATTRFRYGRKNEHIVNAIVALTKMPRCGINWYAERTPDQNGYPSILVYFDIARNTVENCERLQISFHSPLQQAGELAKFAGKGRKTRWSKDLGGSRRAAEQLAQILGK